MFMTIQECNKIVNEFSSHNKVVTYSDCKYRIVRAFVSPSEEGMLNNFILDYLSMANPENISIGAYVEYSSLIVSLECINLSNNKIAFLRYSDVYEQLK